MSEKRLNFIEFVDAVKDNIKDYLPEPFQDAEVKVDPFQKLNTAYLGLQVRREDQMVVPNINLNGMFDQYQKEGYTMAAMLTVIAQQLQSEPEVQTAWLKDYSQVKDHLFIRVSDVKENMAFLAKAPHKEVDGLAVSYHIAFEGQHGVEASTPLTNQMMVMYGVTAEQLHTDALESSQRLYPAKFRNMNEIMAEMMGGVDADMMPPMEPQEGSPLMVLTNTQGIHGASALFYPGQLDAIAQQVGSDFFVLPSSVHETLILADDGTMEPDSLQFMVREINQSTVAPEDRLSDFVYHYDAQDHVLERAETFAGRMAEKEQARAVEPEAVTKEQEQTQEAVPAEKPSAAERSGEGKSAPDADRGDAGGRKERRSVLGRRNEKKEQVKAQPKKSGPNRAQEASI